MLNLKKTSIRTNIFFDKKLEDEEKKVDWEKRQNKSQGLWFEAANIESYKFSEKGVDIW